MPFRSALSTFVRALNKEDQSPSVDDGILSISVASKLIAQAISGVGSDEQPASVPVRELVRSRGHEMIDDADARKAEMQRMCMGDATFDAATLSGAYIETIIRNSNETGFLVKEFRHNADAREEELEFVKNYFTRIFDTYDSAMYGGVNSNSISLDAGRPLPSSVPLDISDYDSEKGEDDLTPESFPENVEDIIQTVTAAAGFRGSLPSGKDLVSG